MDTIFMNSENSRTSEYHVLLLKFTDKLDLRRAQKTVALSNLSIYYTWKNIKGSYNNNKFKISAPTWSEEFELPDGSYSVSDIQDYFEYILKKHSESVDNKSIRIYVNKIQNRITFKIKSGYYLELLTPETMKLLGSTENKITTDKNGENEPHLEIVKLVLVHCNLVNNDYQQNSRILFTFVPNKTFSSLLEILPKNHVFLKTFNSVFQEIKIWFTDQTSKLLEVEDKIDITLIIKCYRLSIKMCYSIETRERRYVKGYGFLSFAKNFGIKYGKKLMNTAIKTGTNFNSKYGKKLTDTAIKTGKDFATIAGKKIVQKTAEATGDLIGNKIADKITSASKKSQNEEIQSNEVNDEIPKERYIQDNAIDNAKDIDIVMSIYNLIEYSNNYARTTGSLWQYFRDDPNDNLADSKSFKSKIKITGKTLANDNEKDVEIMVLLKYLSNFWRTLEMPLINCEVNLILTRSSTCVMTNSNGAGTFAITDTKLYVPVVTLSTQENTKFLQQFKSGFKRVINWNKYLSKPELIRRNPNLNHLVEPNFQGINRLFVLAFEVDAQRIVHTGYYLPNVEIKDYNIMINGENFFDQPIKK